MRVLIVEDDGDLAEMARVYLTLDGEHDVMVVPDPADVTTVSLDWCDAVLADQTFAGISGCTFLAEVAHTHPQVRRLLWTASPLEVNCPVAHEIFVKPASMTMLQEALRGGT